MVEPSLVVIGREAFLVDCGEYGGPIEPKRGCCAQR